MACGPGYAGEAAFALGAIPTGLDFSSEMIQIAKNRNPLIEFHEGDAQNLDDCRDALGEAGYLSLALPDNEEGRGEPVSKINDVKPEHCRKSPCKFNVVLGIKKYKVQYIMVDCF
ncbi:MAG: class I SAM-dependent methyltransferase [Deltaproteobacteria bacterium]|uniref:class I SAM-dependent methyltransferase n=1 Tax=Desulfobacula sp. TaxID=2593537 RepID=UPI001994F055|nr:class I SAM-dependent methyltransferase [Candidatus Desulfobacula maris]MBL6995581.1 class I SAM-dependent methyltransferase [Desulfobacula sp.]